ARGQSAQPATRAGPAPAPAVPWRSGSWRRPPLREVLLELIKQRNGTAQRQQQDAQLLGQALPARLAIARLSLPLASQGGLLAVQGQALRALAKAQQAGLWQGMLKGVGDRHEDQVVVTRQENQLLFDRFIQCAFITDDWQQAAWAHDLSTAPQRLGEGFRIFAGIILQAGIGLGQARKQLQQALLAAAWTNFLRCQTAEDQSSDPIVVFQCRPGKQARRLCRQHGLEQQL